MNKGADLWLLDNHHCQIGNLVCSIAWFTLEYTESSINQKGTVRLLGHSRTCYEIESSFPSLGEEGKGGRLEEDIIEMLLGCRNVVHAGSRWLP
jgi:hypothetical protein